MVAVTLKSLALMTVRSPDFSLETSITAMGVRALRKWLLFKGAIEAIRDITCVRINQWKQISHRHVSVEGSPIDKISSRLQDIVLARHTRKSKLELAVRHEAY